MEILKVTELFIKPRSLFILLCLALLVPAQNISATYSGTSAASSQSEAQGTNYCSFAGSNGLNLTFTPPQTNSQKQFDYTIMFWFRLASNVNVGYQSLFQIPNGPNCNIVSTVIQCNTGQTIRLSALPDIQQWMYLTFVTNLTANTSLLQINFPESSVSSTGFYMNITTSYLYVGFTNNSLKQSGFQGDMREFHMNSGSIKPSVIPFLFHMNRVFEMSSMAYYQFDPEIGYFQDSFRNQRATQIVNNASVDLDFQTEQSSKQSCSTLDTNQFEELPTFDSSFQSKSIVIPNFSGKEVGYQFTISMWLKNAGGQNFTSNVNQGIQYFTFCKLFGSFSMFFDSQTSFRVNVESLNDQRAYTSPSIFIPLNEWVNIQFTLNAVSGVTVLVINSNGEQIQKQTSFQKVPAQNISNNLLLLQNFQGTIKLFQFWQQTFLLPMSQLFLNQRTNLQVNLDFQRVNYVQSVQSWKDTVSNKTIFPAIIGNGFDFFEMRVPNVRRINYIYPSTIGTLSAFSSLWNGVGCTQSFKYSYTFKTLQQLVSIPQSNQIQAELWFYFMKQPPFNSTINLLQLNSGPLSSMNIYIQNGTLYCDPFGQNNPNDILTYQNVLPLNYSGWQHVSCGVVQSQKVVGQYLAYNMTSSTQQTNFLPLTFGKSIQQSTGTIPNSDQAVDFEITVGDQIQNITFKEVRVWNQLKNSNHLYTNRFKQIDQTDPALSVYYKLNNGNKTVYNEIQTMGATNITYLVVNVLPSIIDSLVICPVDRFFDFRVKGCIANPLDTIPITYIGKYSAQHGLEQTFSNIYQLSTIVLPDQLPKFNQAWQISDQAIDSSQVSTQRTAKELELTAGPLGDGNQFNLTSVISTKKRTFLQQTFQRISPRQCFYMVDKDSNLQFNQVTVQLGSLTQQSKVCVNMQILQVDGCTQDFYNRLLTTVQINSSPKVSNLQNMINSSINSQNRTVTQCFNYLDIIYGMPKNQPINFVISAFWNSSQALDVNSYINTVYQVVFLQQISIIQNITNQYDGFQDSILIDVSRSTFDDGTQAGLMFDWQCPQNFKMICDTFYGSPVIEITQDQFQKLGGDTVANYTFTALVWSLNLGTPLKSSNSVFKQNISISWSKIVAPRFMINVQQLPGQITPAIVASQNSTLYLMLQNYRSTDPNLNFTWSITPQGGSQSQLTSTSTDGSILYIQAGVIKPLTKYTLSASVSVNGGLSTTQNLTFTTTTAPQGGSFGVFPTSGTMFQTMFDFFISGWQQNQTNPLYVTVFGITQKSPLQIFQITRSNIPLGQDGSFNYTTNLPLVVGLQVQIQDSFGELTIRTVDVTISKPSGTIAWAEVAAGVINYPNQTLVRQFYYLSSIAQSCANDLQFNSTTLADCSSAISLMIIQGVKNVLSLNANDGSPNTTAILQAMTSMTNQATQNANMLNLNTSAQAFALLQFISSTIAPFQASVQQINFQQNFVQSIQNIMAYQNTQTQQVEMGRRLQAGPQTILNGLIVLKNVFLDQLCQLNQNVVIVANGLQLVTSIHAVNDNLQDLVIPSKLDGSTIVLPIDQILLSTQSLDNTTNTVCVQVSFMTVNPVSSYVFKNQSMENITFIQVTTLDDQNNRLLTTQGINNLGVNPFQLNINFNNSEQNLIKNQTGCMAFNTQSKPKPWDSSICQSTYTDNQIICKCGSINNFYYGVGNDYNRLIDNTAERIYSFEPSWPFLIIAVLVVFLTFLLPCIACYLDHRDYQAVEMDVYQVSDELIQYMRVQRQYSCEQQLFYKLKDIEVISKQQSFGIMEALGHVRRNMHPIWSFFWKFDYSLKRIIRTAVMQNQFAFVTLALFGIYCNGRQGILSESPYIAAAALGLFCCHPPSIFTWFLKTNLVVKKPTKIDQQTPIEEVQLQDQCLLVKVIFIVVTICYSAVEILLCLLYLTGAKGPKREFRISIEDAVEMLVVWGVSLFWGFFILNEIFCLIATMVGHNRAQKLQKQIKKEKAGCFMKNIDFLFNYPIELCLDALIIHQFNGKNEKAEEKVTNYISNNFDRSLEGKNLNSVNDISKSINTGNADVTIITERIIPNRVQEVSFDIKSDSDEDVRVNDLDDLDDGFGLKSEESDDQELKMPVSARQVVHALVAPDSNPAPRTKMLDELKPHSQRPIMNGLNDYVSDEFSDERNYEHLELADLGKNQMPMKSLQSYQSDPKESNDLEKNLKKKKDKKDKKDKKNKKDKKSKIQKKSKRSSDMEDDDFDF